MSRMQIANDVVLLVCSTWAVPAMKPEATAIGDPQDGRRKITLMFLTAQVLDTEI